MGKSFRTIFPVTISLLIGAVLVSCKEGPETGIQKWLLEELEITADSVTCPSLFARFWGDYSCLGKAEGGEFPILVTRGEGEAKVFRVETGLVDVNDAESSIQEKYYDLTGEFSTVACGKRFRVSVPDTNFSCVVHDPRGKTRLAEITIEDSQGSISFRID